MLTVSEAANHLDFSVTTVKSIPQDDLPYSTTPKGHRRYEPADLIRYLQAKGRRVPPELAKRATEA